MSAQKSANSGRSTRRSTSRSRLAGSVDSRNARASNGSGSRPIASRNARRKKTESLHTGDGLVRRDFSLAKTRESIVPSRFPPLPDEPRPIDQEGQAAGSAAIHVANGDDRFTGAAGVNLPVSRDIGAGGVAYIVSGLTGDVAGRAVRKRAVITSCWSRAPGARIRSAGMTCSDLTRGADARSSRRPRRSRRARSGLRSSHEKTAIRLHGGWPPSA